MPVLVEVLSAPLSPQDRLDLLKLYADAPADWQLSAEQTEQLLEDALAHAELWGGRFNGRLLGAMQLQRDTQGWQLSYLCVRAITRRRGVATRLLDEAQRRAKVADCTLYLSCPGQPTQPLSGSDSLQALLAAKP